LKARDRWVPLAEVARPHGVRGEVRLKVYNEQSDLLLDLDEVLIRLADGEEHEVSVDGARRADSSILLKLHSIDDRDRADELRGALVCARRADFPATEQGEFYACDLEGARVVRPDGAELGKVRELRSYPSIHALVVSSADGGRDWEIPLVEAFVEDIDVDEGLVVLATMEGLER
jgi:16S rRNA processing protein RimM